MQPKRIPQVVVDSDDKVKPSPSAVLLSAFTSFAAGDSAMDINNSQYEDDEEDYPNMWEEVLARGFKTDIVAEYSKPLAHHMIDLHLFLTLSNDDLNHIGIRMGHRKRARKIVSDAIALRDRRTSQSPSASAKKSASPNQRSLRVSSGSISGPSDDPLYKSIRNTKVLYNPDRDITWLCISGQWPTYEEFIDELVKVREGKGFPQTFDRLFFNDKPMPFIVQDGSESMVGILLRIPDLTDRFGTSVASITNRLVLMANFDTNFFLTFHNCAVNPLKSFEEDWVKGSHKGKSVSQLMDSAMRRALKTYSSGVYKMREEMDDYMNEEYNGSEVDRVQGLTRIQKKAGVYKRCAEGSRDAIEQLDAVETMRPFIRTLADGLSTVESMSEEVQSNALSSIDLTIAISEFKGSFNMKIFTYMTILLQPITVATSWYGMNWTVMPELEEPIGYYIFIGISWGVAILLFFVIVFGPDLLTWIKENELLSLGAKPVDLDEEQEDEKNNSGHNARLLSTSDTNPLYVKSTNASDTADDAVVIPMKSFESKDLNTHQNSSGDIAKPVTPLMIVPSPLHNNNGVQDFPVDQTANGDADNVKAFQEN